MPEKIITMHFMTATVRDSSGSDEPFQVQFGTGYDECLEDSPIDRCTYYFFDSLEEMQEFAENCPQELDSDTWVESMDTDYSTVNYRVDVEVENE